MKPNQSLTLRILRLPEVSIKVAQSRSTITNKCNPKSPWFDPSFPKPVKMGARAIGWIEAEIDAWIQAQIDAREAA